MMKFYKSMRRTLLILLCLSSSFAVFAQDKVVSGTVKDETGAPIPGVNVLVKVPHQVP